MTDRELLDLAAKAAGKPIRWDGHVAVLVEPDWDHDDCSAWSPLTDDGDALRLAVKLRIHIQPSATAPGWLPSVECYHAEDSHSEVVEEVLGTDAHAATRRAIVRAAAAIARSRDGSPASKVTRPSEQDAPVSSIGLGAEGEQ